MPVLLASADVNTLSIASLRETASHAQRHQRGRGTHGATRQIGLGRPTMAIAHGHTMVHKASAAVVLKHAGKNRHRT
jgi:hypothetical protein